MNYRFNRILCLYDSYLGHASSHSRGLLFKDFYIKYGWNVQFIDYRNSKHDEILNTINDCDAVYMIKVADIDLYKKIKSQTNTIIIFDFIDSLWTPIHQRAGWQNLNEILSLSDAVFAYNEIIANYANQFSKSIFIIPASVHPEKFKIASNSFNKDKEHLTVGWVGSPGTVQSLTIVNEALVNISKKYKNSRFIFLGCNDISFLKYTENLNITLINDYTESIMINELIKFDVGIYPAPLDMDDYRIRGGGKAFLYMAAGVPPICHYAGGWTDEIIEEETGMLVKLESEWFEKIDKLLSNPALREKISFLGNNYVNEKYSSEIVFKLIDKSLRSIIKHN